MRARSSASRLPPVGVVFVLLGTQHSSFPSSAWERPASKLCFESAPPTETASLIRRLAKRCFGAARSQAELGNEETRRRGDEEGKGQREFTCPAFTSPLRHRSIPAALHNCVRWSSASEPGHRHTRASP